MRLFPLVALVALLAPLAAAQPNGNTTADNRTPSVAPGGGPAGQESVEGAPGVIFGAALLVGFLALAGVMAYVVAQQRKSR